MSVNFTALIVAALVPMALGFIWYHPKVFGNAWMRASGVTEEQTKTGNMLVIFGLSFLFSLMLAYVMNVISYHDGFVYGATYYATDGTMNPDPNSDAGRWLEYYKANFSDSTRTFKHGAFHAFFLAGLFIVLPVFATNALFERKGFKYVAVNAGYWLVCLTIMGGIVAAWKNG